VLDLTPELTQGLLTQLNRRQELTAWQALLNGEDYEHHRALERERYDTTFSSLHRALSAYVQTQLQTLHDSFRGAERPPGAELLGRWLTCVDVFALARATAEDEEWVRAHVGRRPLSAFRVGNSIFFLSGRGRAQWARREFLGLNEDPILRLPYQRKYDHERHGRADEKLRAYFEKLWVASDLLAILAERSSVIDVGTGFEYPELADIESELKELGLVLSIDTLSEFGGGFGLELCALATQSESALTERSPKRPVVDFTVVDGHYRGVLGGYHRRLSGALRPSLSGASLKWIFEIALTQLRRRLRAIVAADYEG
jgi:hypothetical protein